MESILGYFSRQVRNYNEAIKAIHASLKEFEDYTYTKPITVKSPDLTDSQLLKFYTLSSKILIAKHLINTLESFTTNFINNNSGKKELKEKLSKESKDSIKYLTNYINNATKLFPRLVVNKYKRLDVYSDILDKSTIPSASVSIDTTGGVYDNEPFLAIKYRYVQAKLDTGTIIPVYNIVISFSLATNKFKITTVFGDLPFGTYGTGMYYDNEKDLATKLQILLDQDSVNYREVKVLKAKVYTDIIDVNVNTKGLKSVLKVRRTTNRDGKEPFDIQNLIVGENVIRKDSVTYVNIYRSKTFISNSDLPKNFKISVTKNDNDYDYKFLARMSDTSGIDIAIERLSKMGIKVKHLNSYSIETYEVKNLSSKTDANFNNLGIKYRRA
jgi:hypothetical protein